MQKLLQIQKGSVVISNGNKTYVDTLANFKLDCPDFLDVDKEIIYNLSLQVNVVDGNFQKTQNNQYNATIEKIETILAMQQARQPEPEAEPIENIRTKNIASLKTTRNQIEKSPISSNGHLFDFDDDSRDRINEAIGFMERNNIEKMAWVLADNTSTMVSPSDLYSVKDAVAIRSSLLHEHYNKLKASINDAQTETEINEIVASAFAELA